MSLERYGETAPDLERPRRNLPLRSRHRQPALLVAVVVEALAAVGPLRPSMVACTLSDRWWCVGR